MRLLLILILCFCFGITSCKNAESEDVTVEVRTYTLNDLEYPDANIQVPNAVQNEFIEKFFVPWKVEANALLDSLPNFPGKDLSYLEKYLKDDDWYGENKKRHKKWQREEIVINASAEDFPNFLKKGIVISHTDLRRIPSSKPGFDLYSKAGEGYPFDYFQETALWANTPVLIAHTSNDGQWCYIISPYYKGWIPIHDVAVVNEEFVENWLTPDYCLPLSDKLNLRSNGSNYAINAKMGMVLPFEESKDNSNKITVYYANSDENQNGKILKAEVDRNEVTTEDFKITKPSLVQLASNLEGRPYGWGGNLENRDCSSMIRDLLSSYKIWLPRDSKDQIEVGLQHELTGSADKKMKLIKEKGVPFLTILRKKGHNMLYVGDAPNGEPLILHAVWGLKTSYSNEELSDFLKTYPIEGLHKNEDGKLIGRHVIGESVITSVTAGSNSNNVSHPLIDDIYMMTNVLE